jgi:hypothetical protein
LQEFAIDARRTLIHNHQVRIKAEDGLFDDRPASGFDRFGAGAKNPPLATLWINPVQTWQLYVINAFGDSEGVNHLRSGYKQDRRLRILVHQLLSQQESPSYVVEPDGVVRVEKDFRC